MLSLACCQQSSESYCHQLVRLNTQAPASAAGPAGPVSLLQVAAAPAAGGNTATAGLASAVLSDEQAAFAPNAAAMAPVVAASKAIAPAARTNAAAVLPAAAAQLQSIAPAAAPAVGSVEASSGGDKYALPAIGAALSPAAPDGLQNQP